MKKQNNDEDLDLDLSDLKEESRASKELKNHAVLMLAGPITENHLGVCHELLGFHYDEDFNDHVTLLINSPGGMCEIGWAIIDVMNFVRYPVHTVCIGFAGSMAADIFVNGDNRVMGEHSTLMIHPHSTLIGGSHHKLIASMKGDKIEYERRLEHYVINSRYTTREQVEALFTIPGEDLYLTPKETLDHGLTDGIARNSKKKNRIKDKSSRKSGSKLPRARKKSTSRKQPD